MKSNLLTSEKENELIVKAYAKLLRHSKSIISRDDSKVIKKAFRIALDAHKDMRRKSGEPYIFHPISVAQICVDEIGLVKDVSGRSKKLENWIGKPIVKVDERYFRPAEVETLLGDATKAKTTLGWEPKISFDQLVSEMIESDINDQK